MERHVQALHKFSRMLGSAGCSVSFQSRGHKPRDESAMTRADQIERRSTCARMVARSAASGFLAKNGASSSRIDLSRKRRDISPGQQRPEDDVSVRILAAVVALAFEHAEPLRPIAVGCCWAKARVRRSRKASKRRGEEHFKGPASRRASPVAAGILFEPAWSKVMDERVVDEPGRISPSRRRPRPSDCWRAREYVAQDTSRNIDRSASFRLP